MKNLSRTFKVIYIFLVLCFIFISISNAQGKGKNKGYWMDVVILPIDSLCAETDPVLAVDTRDGCKGAFIPFGGKNFYINTIEHCFDLPQPLFSGSSITIQSVEIGPERDRKTGEILGIRFWLEDVEQKFYRTDLLEPPFPVATDPNGFMVPINQCVAVYPQTGKGKKRPVGYLTVGTIEFWQK